METRGMDNSWINHKRFAFISHIIRTNSPRGHGNQTQTRKPVHLCTSTCFISTDSMSLLCYHFLFCVHSAQKQPKKINKNLLLWQCSVPLLNSVLKFYIPTHTRSITSLGTLCGPQNNNGTENFPTTKVVACCKWRPTLSVAQAIRHNTQSLCGQCVTPRE
jgi:hypothetical protein